MTLDRKNAAIKPDCHAETDLNHAADNNGKEKYISCLRQAHEPAKSARP